MGADPDLIRRIRATFGHHPLIVVSNRAPYRIEERAGRGVRLTRSARGVATALEPVLRLLSGLWIAWDHGADCEGVDGRRRLLIPPRRPRYALERLRLPPELARQSYEGYANQLLWPLVSAETGQVVVADRHWRAYRQVNERFARAVIAALDRLGARTGMHPPLVFYLGDEAADEPAFAAVNAAGGITVRVGARVRETLAAYRLDDAAAVARFLERIEHVLERKRFRAAEQRGAE